MVAGFVIGRCFAVMSGLGGRAAVGQKAATNRRGSRSTAAAGGPPQLPDVPEGWQTDADVWAAHEEFQAQAGLDKINAQQAYAKGVTGV